MKLEPLKTDNSNYSSKNYFSKNPIRNYSHLGPLERILKIIKNKKFDSIAEIGCADGIFLLTLSKLCKELHATDIQESFINNLSKVKIKNLHLHVDDIQNSTLSNNKFDLVICLETLEHLSNPSKAISEINRTMKKNAHCIISVPIEIGFPLLLKYLARLILGYGKSYDGGYSFRELVNAFFKKPDEIYHSKHLGHKGFDYRSIVRLLRNNFIIEKIEYFPFSILGSNFNYRIILLCKKTSP